jgi:Fur family ferric uptake transcriptional regulator
MTAEEILQRHKLKNTGCRKFILTELLRSDAALSEEEIKKPFPELFDRVTFYRTLKTLEEQHVIHRIVLHDNSVKYALNGHHSDQNPVHAHFHCGKCDEVLCLEGKSHFDAELPADFVTREVFVVVEGFCAGCNLTPDANP